MELDLEKHKIFIPSLGIEVIPYSVVVKFIEDLHKNQISQFENVLSDISKTLNNLDITKLEDDKNLS